MIRIFVVDDDAITREVIRGMIAMEPDMELIGESDCLDGVMETVTRLRPSILLLDVQLPDGDGPDLAEKLAEMPAHPGIIMISVQKDVAFLRKAMQAGARDYLLKPFTGVELVDAIRRVNAEAASRGGSHQAECIAVWSCRGGAGGSSFSISFASQLAMMGKRTALIDGDLFMGDIAFLLNTPYELSWTHWANECLSGTVDGERYLTFGPNNLMIMPTAKNPVQAELIKPGMGNRLLQALSDRFDFVIVDLHRLLDEMTLELAEACQRLWLVTDCSCTGVKNLHLITGVLDQLRIPWIERGVILNKARREDRSIIEKIQKEYPVKGILPFDEKIEDGWLKGDPLIIDQPRSPYSKTIKEMASGFMAREKVKVS
ncbi:MULTISPECIES: response regulator [Aminobacterium]|jgi:pilus assembly protein CpaE|uniref:response regulator n=1 Tax=Aminobacterium TaxID=81466 RepID=UPI00257DCA00|nr:response regulator [Aminobacterium sp. UBA4834]